MNAANSPRLKSAPPTRLLTFARTRRGFLSAICLVAFLVLAHLSSENTFHSEGTSEAGWQRFRTEYHIEYFGTDGQFVRAVQNGYNVVFHTYKYAPRFTRKTVNDRVNSCAGCHTPEDLAYAFVNSDRFDSRVGRRVSFEERVQRCYIASLDGFAPTVYDPAIRDIRLLARAVAHDLQLSEGALKKGR